MRPYCVPGVAAFSVTHGKLVPLPALYFLRLPSGTVFKAQDTSLGAQQSLEFRAREKVVDHSDSICI